MLTLEVGWLACFAVVVDLVQGLVRAGWLRGGRGVRVVCVRVDQRLAFHGLSVQVYVEVGLTSGNMSIGWYIL